MPISVPLPIAKGGTGEVAAGSGAFSAGVSNTASASNALALGYSNTASAISASAAGYLNTSSATFSQSFGFSNTASGSASLAVGYINQATGLNGNAVGRSNWAYGSRSNAFGYGCYGGGTNSSAFGYFTNTNVANTAEFGYWVGPSTRAGAIRTDSSGTAALTYNTSSTALTDGGATAGSEAAGTLPRGMVGFRVTSGQLFSDYNVGGSVTSNLLARSGSTALGYNTAGTGGAVTQLTSKSTPVTLDKLCGQITMHNESLSHSTTVSFLLNNTFIQSTDVVIVNIQSGATTNAYATDIGSVNTGSCRIQLRNIQSSGSLSEAVVLNFAVIKATNA